MPSNERCNIKACRRLAWADTAFCFDHLVQHVSSAIPNSDVEEFRKRLRELLKTISYREREILKLRHMSLTANGYTYTLNEVGYIFKISAARASQIEQTALQKLRRPVRFREIEELITVFSFEKPKSGLVQVLQLCEEEILKYLAKNPNDVRNIPPDTFERIIAEIMASSGFDVELTQRTRDGGKDIIAVSTDAFGIKTNYIVECKRYASHRPVRVEMVRSLYGVMQQHQADHAILATTSYFTKDATSFCDSPSVWNLHLKDFGQISDWITTYDQQINKGGFLL